MKKLCTVLFPMISVFSLSFAQQRPSGNTGMATQSRTMVSQQASIRRQVIPIPKKIQLIAYRRTLVTAPPANNMEHKVTNTGVAGNRANVTSMSNARLVVGQPTVSKSFTDGRKASFTLTKNTGSWATAPAYTQTVKGTSTDNSNPGWNCTVSNETFNAQSTSFMNATPAEKGSHLYPGAIYTFDDYSSGNFREYNNGRSPITVYTTTTVGNNSSLIQSPNGATISQGVSNIVNQFTPTQAGADHIEQYLYTENQSDYAIMVAAGGSYSGFSGQASFSHSQSEQHIYVTINAIKPMYTISVQQTPGGYFMNGQTPQANSPLIMIQDVTYGARILANLDITISAKTDIGKLGLQYNAGVASASLDMNAIANDKTITYTLNAYMVGVPVSTPIVTVQNFESQLSSIFSQCNYRTAAPIQYGLSDMDGSSLGIESATDQFTVRNCTPANEVFALQSVLASIQTGDDGKNDNSEFWMEVYKGTPSSNVKIGTYYDNHTEFNRNYSPTVPITLVNTQYNPNGYTLTDFNNGGAILLRLTAHGHMGDDWNVSNLKITFNFMSQKNTPLVKTFNLSNFKFSDKSNPVFYFDNNFNLIQ